MGPNPAPRHGVHAHRGLVEDQQARAGASPLMTQVTLLALFLYFTWNASGLLTSFSVFNAFASVCTATRVPFNGLKSRQGTRVAKSGTLERRVETAAAKHHEKPQYSLVHQSVTLLRLRVGWVEPSRA